MENKYTITVSVDTSYKNGKAATAYYIKHEKFVVKDSEYLGEVENNCVAELLGIVCAVKRMTSEIRDRVIKRVYITCDNKYALDKIKTPEYNYLFDRFDEVIPQHINAHLGINSPRQWVNNWCDIESRYCLIDHLE